MPRSRITVTDLRSAIAHLNLAAGVGNEPYRRVTLPDGTHKNVQVPHVYVLDGAYGGWKLQRNHPSGGVDSVTSGYVPARELYERIHAFIDGYETAQRDRERAVFGGADPAPVIA